MNKRSIADIASLLVAVLSDGKPHSNREIAIRTGYPWNYPGWPRVRKHLRNHGFSFVYDSGYWTMTDSAVKLNRDNQRRDRDFYSELCSRYRMHLGAIHRNPTDLVLVALKDGVGALAFMVGQRLGLTPAEIAHDLQLLA